MSSVKKVVPDTAYQMVATWHPICLRQVVLSLRGSNQHQSSTTTTNTEIAKDKSAISKCSTLEKIVKPITTEQREDNYRQQERKTAAFSSMISMVITACGIVS